MLKTSAQLMGAAATAALLIGPLTAPAMADDGDTQSSLSTVAIEQVQLDNVWSGMSVDVPDSTWELVSTSTAVGNAAAGLIKSGDIDVDIDQRLEGNVDAVNTVTGGYVENGVITTTAYGNSATGGTWAGTNYYRADQVSNGDVSAATQIDLQGSNQITSATTAIANVSVPTDEYGTNRAFQIQDSNASVSASTNAVVCCAATSATFVTTAGANAVSSTGLTSTNFNGAVQTTAAGETIQAVTDVYMRDGNDVLAVTSTFGNSVTVDNQWGYATLGREGSELYQSNQSDIDSQTYVTLNNWSGSASATAYGVGNSALISNVGSDTALFANQQNYGDVYTATSFDGNSSSGGTGIVNATSIGNAVTANLCNVCSGDAVLQGGVTQMNAGQVIARGSAYATTSGGIYGSATAVGNSATYQATGN